MLKMFRPASHSGGSPEYWDDVWAAGGQPETTAFCTVDPIRRLLDPYVRPGMTMLEGGCGHGHYVVHYASRGVPTVGVDFASETLRRLKRAEPKLPLALGDVAQLPFHRGAFDVYYSGGVVEHFERGPTEALEEARRVLKPGGTLLISVPYLSPMRRLLAPFRRDEWRSVAREEAEGQSSGTFVQYAYTPSEFSARLEAAGFRVTTRSGYAFVWGLQDLAVLRMLVSAVSTRMQSGDVGETPPPLTEQPPQEMPSRSLRQQVKRAVVSEDVSMPVAGPFVRMLRWFCSNMMLYVCIAPKSTPPTACYTAAPPSRARS